MDRSMSRQNPLRTIVDGLLPSPAVTYACRPVVNAAPPLTAAPDQRETRRTGSAFLCETAFDQLRQLTGVLPPGNFGARELNLERSLGVHHQGYMSQRVPGLKIFAACLGCEDQRVVQQDGPKDFLQASENRVHYLIMQRHP